MPAQLRDDDVRGDTLWGVAEISVFIGRDVRQTRWLIQRGIIRVTKPAPKTIIASKREIREDLRKSPAAR